MNINFHGDIHIHIHINEQKSPEKSELGSVILNEIIRSSQDNERKTPPKFYQHNQKAY